MTLYAHSGSKPDKSDWQTLEDHLRSVSDLASQFAGPFGASAWARAAGVLHDAGKASPKFQRRLEGSPIPYHHALTGARLARVVYPGERFSEGDLLAPLIAGHHGGLRDWYELRDDLMERVCPATDDDLRDEQRRFASFRTLLPAENLTLMRTWEAPSDQLDANVQPQLAAFRMFTLEHLLFSSLVDADWLDTERVMSPEDHARREAAVSSHDALDVLLVRLEDHLEDLASRAADTPVNRARADMLARARAAADTAPGIFALGMPTGSGKTLTSLDFALRHALRNGQSRVIYAIPFMSIVEQNAAVFKECLGANNVLEHFSSYDYGLARGHDDSDGNATYEQGLRERMLVQNWDAPVVVTTNVQLFESLFAAETSRSRKVHNVANSVIVLDEAQSLPSNLLLSTLAMLESLVSIAHVSVVLCTATQPRLEQCMPFRTPVRQIIEEKDRHEDVFDGRVTFDTTHALPEDALGLDELVGSMLEERQVLCVVSSRMAAKEVFLRLREISDNPDGIYHLTALMVPAHRSAVLEEIRSRLRMGKRCLVVSTQLIEAGVDVDFPVVLRETAGVDSILQAAGRCNREGRLGHPGRVVVFSCEDFDASRAGGNSDDARPKRQRNNWLSQERAVAESIIGAMPDPFGEDGVRSYFDCIHDIRDLDDTVGGPVLGEITQTSRLGDYAAHGRYPFRTIAERYRFMPEETRSIVVPWGAGGEALVAALELGDYAYQDVFPQVQRLSIDVRPWVYKKYEESGALRRIGTFPVAVLETRDGAPRLYDDERGLLDPDEVTADVLFV